MAGRWVYEWRRKDWCSVRDEGLSGRIGSDRLCKECSESPHNQVGFVTVYVSTVRSVERWLGASVTAALAAGCLYPTYIYTLGGPWYSGMRGEG